MALAFALAACERPQGGASPAGGAPPPAGSGAAGDHGFARAAGAREWRWPRDHGAHPAFATEWWYTTGIVRTPEGRRFGFELTFFRRGLVPDSARAAPRAAPAGPSRWRARHLLLAHAAITDEEADRFVAEERLTRAGGDAAGADTTRLDVWIGEWRLAASNDGFGLRVPAATTAGRLGLDLTLRGARPPVLHGAGGLSAKDARPDPHASWYVSLPRLETSGTLTVTGERYPVRGSTWMDHEFFSGGLAPGLVGWDWFSVRLADGRDLMLFRLRDATGATRYAAGTVTDPDGGGARALDLGGASFEPLERWRSPTTGAEYPVAWRLRLPAEDLHVRTRTPLREQEIAGDAAGGFSYWEGLVDVSATWGRETVDGEGYVEMTGYDAPLDLR